MFIFGDIDSWTLNAPKILKGPAVLLTCGSLWGREASAHSPCNPQPRTAVWERQWRNPGHRRAPFRCKGAMAHILLRMPETEVLCIICMDDDQADSGAKWFDILRDIPYQSSVDGLHEGERLVRVVTVEVVGIDGPDEGTGNAQVVDELGLDGERGLVVVADPVWPVVHVGGLVAGVHEDLPRARDGLRHLLVHGLVVNGLQDLLVAPDADLLRVRSPRDAGVGRAVETALVLSKAVFKFNYNRDPGSVTYQG